MKKMCLLSKRRDAEFGPKNNYFIALSKGFFELPVSERAKYVIVAQNYNREVLKKMKQLAIEGDLERKD
jgi:hypothetical protein